MTRAEKAEAVFEALTKTCVCCGGYHDPEACTGLYAEICSSCIWQGTVVIKDRALHVKIYAET